MSKMNRHRYGRFRTGALFVTALLPLLSACGKADAPGPASGSVRPLRVDAGIELQTSQAPLSRAIVSSFTDGSSLGLYICDHEAAPTAFTPQMNGYYNLTMQYTTGSSSPPGWAFRRSGETAFISQIGIRKGAHVDIYGYYPYNAAHTGTPAAIPFTAGSTDYMWAEVTEPGPGRDINEPEYDELPHIPLKLNMKHAMTCLQLAVKVNYSGSIVVRGFELVDTTNTDRIILSGTYSSIDGTITRGNTGNSLPVSFDTTVRQTADRDPGDPANPSAYTYFDLLFPAIPEGIEAGDLQLKFLFENGAGGGNTEPITGTYTLPASVFQYDGTKCGLQQGTKYVFKFDVDNYVKFNPIGVVPWDDTVEDFNYEI